MAARFLMYCTEQNLIDRFGTAELIQLTDRAGLGVIDSTVIAPAIADAAAEIDGYLIGFSVPVDPVPENLTRIACDVVMFNLYRGRMVDDIEARYKYAVDYLRQIASGRIKLISGTTEQAPAMRSVIASNTAFVVPSEW